MTDDTMPLLDALLKRGGGISMEGLAEAILRQLMVYDVEGQIRAGCYERNEEQTTQRNGHPPLAGDRRWLPSAKTLVRYSAVDGA